MTLTLFALVLTITASIASYVQAIETIGFVLVPLNDSYCGSRGLSYLAKYPLEDIADGTLVLNATNIDAKPNTTIYFQPCNTTDTPKAMNSSDPSTWLVSLPGQCAKFWANSTGIEWCQFSAVTLQTSQLSEHCNNNASADLCNPFPLPTPAPSSAVPHEVVTTAFVITVGSLVASLICDG